MTDEQADGPGVPEPPLGFAVADNPAGRLRFWLGIGQTRREEIDRDADREARGQERLLPHRLYEVWCHIWDCDPAEPHSRLKYTRLGIGLIDAATEARAQAEALPAEVYMAKHALEDFHQIENATGAFAENPDMEFVSMFARITDTGWRSLKMMDALLSNEAPQRSLTIETSANLRKLANDLIEGLLSDTVLDPQTRMDLISKVREVDEALIRATVLGTASVVDTCNGLLGLMYRTAARSAEVLQHPLTQMVLHLLGSVYTATESSGALNEIAPAQFVDLLSLPAPKA